MRDIQKKGPTIVDPFIRVRMKGLEPPRPKALDPKSSAATNYATSALRLIAMQIWWIFSLLQNILIKKYRHTPPILGLFNTKLPDRQVNYMTMFFQKK